jgi:hypothetical protein
MAAVWALARYGRYAGYALGRPTSFGAAIGAASTTAVGLMRVSARLGAQPAGCNGIQRVAHRVVGHSQ